MELCMFQKFIDELNDYISGSQKNDNFDIMMVKMKLSAIIKTYASILDDFDQFEDIETVGPFLDHSFNELEGFMKFYDSVDPQDKEARNEIESSEIDLIDDARVYESVIS